MSAPIKPMTPAQLEALAARVRLADWAKGHWVAMDEQHPLAMKAMESFLVFMSGVRAFQAAVIAGLPLPGFIKGAEKP